MSFLDDSVPLPRGGRGRPSFLDDDSGTENHTRDGVPSFLTPETTPRRPGTSGAFLDMFDINQAELNVRLGSANGEKSKALSAAATFALEMEGSLTSTNVLSSAEELHFPSTSLRHKSWDLYRSKILGKGSFGCATLYSTDRRLAAAGIGAGSPSSFAVVKDVNIQTMTCREEEMVALRDEVSALELVAGHPNAVQLLDYHHDEPGMMAYIITEFCEGGDMSGAVERAKRGEYVPPVPIGKCSYTTSTKLRHIPEEIVSSVLIQVVSALHHLHVDARILHRDLKPHNLFLLSDGITVRLGDFGVAALLQSISQKAKIACGSPFYMAPELCAEKPYDGKADIWSLGVLLYEMMALNRPFNASSAPALSQLIIKGKCVPLWERTSSCGDPLKYSQELMEIVMSMLTTDPTARPTLRRLLRSTYVRKNLFTVPKTVLQTGSYYEKIFEPSEVRLAVERSLFEGTHTVAVSCSRSNRGGDESEYYEDDFEDDFEDD